MGLAMAQVFVSEGTVRTINNPTGNSVGFSSKNRDLFLQKLGELKGTEKPSPGGATPFLTGAAGLDSYIVFDETMA